MANVSSVLPVELIWSIVSFHLNLSDSQHLVIEAIHWREHWPSVGLSKPILRNDDDDDSWQRLRF